jgi:hypothetical protein
MPQYQTRNRSESRSRDFVLYVAISLGFMALAIALGRSNFSLKTGGQILSLVLFTGILYGCFIASNRTAFRLWTFWLLTAAMLTVHSVLFLVINLRVDQWRGIWNGVMFAEIPILDYMKRRFVHSHRNHSV